MESEDSEMRKDKRVEDLFNPDTEDSVEEDAKGKKTQSTKEDGSSKEGTDSQ
jgi:hypothetical protein